MLLQHKLLGLSLCMTMFFNNCRFDKTKLATISSDSVMTISVAQNTPLKNMFGINSYEWNFLLDPANPNLKNHIYEPNMALIRSFSAVRHYMNWNKLENTKGNYTYNPTNNGSWNYDLIYTRCKQDSMLVLADLKNCPTWLVSTYPPNLQDNENVPAPYGSNLSDPASYADQARAAFQFAARYGYNTTVNPVLVKVDSRPRWANDPPNEVKIGLGLIKYIECDNERDKWWKSEATKQTPEEYAANLSAFYDGNKGKLGNNAGVKTADPSMQVVMCGLATADVNFVKRMVNWCKINRGYKPDGSIDLCFDVINYHLYSNDGNILRHSKTTTGVAPELSMAGIIADSFIEFSRSLPHHPEVWVTEVGYDINQQSNEKAVPVGNKSVLLTQADWIIRSSLLYMRHGVKRIFFYQLFDDKPNGTIQFATSGLAENAKRRPAADYILQVNKLMGNYIYKGTINKDPLVDKYQLGKRIIYVLTVPDQKDRTTNYQLNLGTPKATIYTLKPGTDTMGKKEVSLVNGKLNITVSETPVFVKAGVE